MLFRRWTEATLLLTNSENRLFLLTDDLKAISAGLQCKSLVCVHLEPQELVLKFQLVYL